MIQMLTNQLRSGLHSEKLCEGDFVILLCFLFPDRLVGGKIIIKREFPILKKAFGFKKDLESVPSIDAAALKTKSKHN